MMSDITKCTGKDCPFKDDCKRFTTEGNDYWQSWFFEPPFKIVDDKFKCDMFWVNNVKNVWNELLNESKNT